MSNNFRYNENAQNLEDNLEEVLESHKAEQEQEKAAAAGALPTEPPALARISAGQTASERVRHIVDERKSKSASAADRITEHRLREDMRKISERGPNTVTDFLAQAKS